MNWPSALALTSLAVPLGQHHPTDTDASCGLHGLRSEQQQTQPNNTNTRCFRFVCVYVCVLCNYIYIYIYVVYIYIYTYTHTYIYTYIRVYIYIYTYIYIYIYSTKQMLVERATLVHRVYLYLVPGSKTPVPPRTKHIWPRTGSRRSAPDSNSRCSN